MDSHIKEFYQQSSGTIPRAGSFHKVIALHENPQLTWKEVSSMMPASCKGWLELCHISVEDRIEFTRDFWLSKLPYQESLPPFLMKFFASLDDIGVFLTQQGFDDPFIAHLVYSLKDDNGFFTGLAPATESDRQILIKEFPNTIFPVDYVAFTSIHNGFCKLNDTGIKPLKELPTLYAQFQKQLKGLDLPKKGDVSLDRRRLIPFYESYGTMCYQCFWEDWYPDNEMGNIYYSELTRSISDVQGVACLSDQMAFPSFSEWLMFYLEKIE